MTMRRTAWLGAALLAMAVVPLGDAHLAASPVATPGGPRLAATPAPAPVPISVAAPGLPFELAGPESVLSAPSPVPLLPDGAAQAMPDNCNKPQNGGQVPPILFCCPTPPGGLPQNLGTPAGDDRFVYAGCPFRIYDTNLVGNYHFGNTALAVNPLDDREMVFTSLHSEPTSGPTPRSRVASQSHTSFTSRDQGVTWQDQPVSSGPGLGEGSDATFDTLGNMYIAYLWAQANGNDTTGFASAFCLYKAASPSTEDAVFAAYSGGTCVESRAPTDPIARIHLVDVPHPAPPAATNRTGNGTADGNETVPPPSGADDVGESSEPTDPTLERIAAVWHERAAVPEAGKTGMAGWIDARLTGTGARDPWTAIPKPIGPCMDASNAVAYDGAIYVVCTVEKGTKEHPYPRSRARVGDHDLWRIDPLTGQAELVGPTSMAGGHPVLSVTEDGYFVMVTTRLRTPDESAPGAEVRAAFSWYGTSWEPIPGDLGGLLNRLLGGRATYDAAVTALQIGEYDGSPIAALVYMEWQQPADTATPQPPPPPDPSNPTGFYQLNDYKKAVVTFDSCSFPVAASQMQLGTQVDPSNFDAYTAEPSLFDDQQDGLVRHRQANGMDVFYFAVNDYGAMQYGAFQATTAQFCPTPPPPLPPPVPVVPQALTITSPAVTVTGAMVAFAAISAVTYLVLAKRRVPTYAVTEAK